MEDFRLCTRVASWATHGLNLLRPDGHPQVELKICTNTTTRRYPPPTPPLPSFGIVPPTMAVEDNGLAWCHRPSGFIVGGVALVVRKLPVMARGGWEVIVRELALVDRGRIKRINWRKKADYAPLDEKYMVRIN